MKTTYKAHTIVTEAKKHTDSGWTASVSVYSATDELVMGPVDIGREVMFATAELAENAALLLGRAWVDHRR